MISKNLRWDSYVLLKGTTDVNSFWKDHIDLSKKVLFILGKGFDLRMNNGISQIARSCTNIQISCLLIEYEEEFDSSSRLYNQVVDDNLKKLYELENVTVHTRKIEIWKGVGRSKRRIGDKEAADIFSSYEDIDSYTDIIVDISALPRGIYFSLIGKLLTLIDYNKIDGDEKHNLFILTSENATIDRITKEDNIDEDLKYTFGFGGGLELTSDNPVIWFPILGENKIDKIIKAYNKINPLEICPLLPFPAKDVRRPDTLIIEYHQLLFDELRIEPQNLLYVPEQNPFEVYRSLSNAVINYNKTLSVINGCKVAISSFSSKLLSIGALITAYEFNNRTDEKIGVGILNVDSNGYKIEVENQIVDVNEESELFLSWLTGEPYNINE